MSFFICSRSPSWLPFLREVVCVSCCMPAVWEHSWQQSHPLPVVVFRSFLATVSITFSGRDESPAPTHLAAYMVAQCSLCNWGDLESWFRKAHNLCSFGNSLITPSLRLASASWSAGSGMAVLTYSRSRLAHWRHVAVPGRGLCSCTLAFLFTYVKLKG